MAKKQKSQSDIIEEKTANGLKFLDGVSPEMLATPNYIPEHIRPSLDEWVRNKRKEYDVLTDLMENSDKASPEYDEAVRGIEKISKDVVTAKSQTEMYKGVTGQFKTALGSISKGTKEENIYTNMIVFGAQSDAVGFDKSGRMSFAGVYGSGKNDISVFKLDDMSSLENGMSPIITEPLGTKNYVWKMAQQTKQNSSGGLKFDADWTYTKIYNDLSEGGPQNTIGVAYADLAGDNKSKSFAEMYEEGLKDQSYYVHPETGETMPSDSAWMKDPQNADILKQYLGKYITEIMKDVHGPTINEDTGQVKKTQAELTQDLIKKYKK
tara:strand:- start:123 stop:1091 length:969 start_codon:yes stop_codon:yes gene_type:complete